MDFWRGDFDVDHLAQTNPGGSGRVKASKVPGRIEDKKFIPNNPRNYENAMTAYNGKKVTMSLAVEYGKRTLPQNSYLWGGPYAEIAEATGNTKDDVHEGLGELFLMEDTGKKFPERRSTASLDRKEFMQYLDDIIRWAAEELGLVILYPNETEMWKFKDDTR